MLSIIILHTFIYKCEDKKFSYFSTVRKLTNLTGFLFPDFIDLFLEFWRVLCR